MPKILGSNLNAKITELGCLLVISFLKLLIKNFVIIYLNLIAKNHFLLLYFKFIFNLVGII